MPETREARANELRGLANDVEGCGVEDIRNASHLRDCLLGMADSLYCKTFEDEDEEYDDGE